MKNNLGNYNDKKNIFNAVKTGKTNPNSDKNYALIDAIFNELQRRSSMDKTGKK
jgi:hypothetical protein